MTLTTRDRPAASPDAAPKKPLGLGGFAKGKAKVGGAKAASYALFAALAAALLLGGSAFIRPAAKAPPVKIPQATVGPEGVAELFVATWLSAGPGDSLAPYFPGTVEFGSKILGATAPPPAPRVLRTSTIRADELAENYWSVTVAAQTQLGEGSVATRYFRVPIMLTRIKLYVASALPSEVAGPVGAKKPDLAVGSFDRPGPGEPIGISVAQFLAALLTGQGELSRYTSADSTVKPITPVPFTSVELTGMAARKLNGDDAHMEVVATATATDANGHLTSLTFPLEMSRRDARWEVIRVLLAPSLSSTQPDLTPATTVAPSTTSTTPASTTTSAPSTTTTTRRN